MDIAGPFDVTGAGRERYLLVVVCHKTGKAWLRTMKLKTDIRKKLLEIRREVTARLDEVSEKLRPKLAPDGLVRFEQIHSDLDGIFQVASFHPDYLFAGASPEDVTNYTNRSPYPILHLLREESLTTAIDSHPDPEGIPARNMALLESMGLEKVQALLQACSKPQRS